MDAPTLRDRRGRLLRVLFAAHGIVTLAAAVVLVAAPAAIPATVGIELSTDGSLLSYFLAAAEIAIAVLSLGAVRISDPAALRLIVVTFIVFHLSTAVLEVVYLVLDGPAAALVANIAVRVVVAALFIVALRAVVRDDGCVPSVE